MKTVLTIACAASVLAACATVPPDGDDRPPADTCRAEPGQVFVGQRATGESGAAIMAATRSTRLRWVPPRTAVTMEYAFSRVTVNYDDDYRVTKVACG